MTDAERRHADKLDGRAEKRRRAGLRDRARDERDARLRQAWQESRKRYRAEVERIWAEWRETR